MLYKNVLSVILVVILASVVGSAQADLVANYQFEGNFDDSSGNGHDAGGPNGASRNVTIGPGAPNGLNPDRGYQGEDEDSFVNVWSDDGGPGDPMGLYNTDFTVALWVKPSEVDLDGWHTLFRYGGDGYFMEIGGGRYLNTGGGYWNSLWIDDASSFLSAGLWIHLAMTFSERYTVPWESGTFGKVELFVNGVSLDSRSDGYQEPEPGWWNDGLYIGNLDISGESWTGGIDDFRIYDEALDEEEIQTLIEIGPPFEVNVDILPGKDPNLVTANTQSKGRLPIAILKSEDYNLNHINLDSISIAGSVFPVKKPMVAGDHLMVHVSRRDLVIALGLDAMEAGTVVPVTIEGSLITGQSFFGTDNVVVQERID